MLVPEVSFLTVEIRFVQHVDHLFRQIDKSLGAVHMFDPVICVDVLDHVATIVIERRAEEGAKADDLMVRLVAAVIEDDIEWSEFPVYPGKKCRICLAADPDEDVLVGDLVRLAGLVDVDSDYG